MENQRRAQNHAGHGVSQFVLSKTILNNLSQFNLKPITKLVLLYLCDCYNPKKSEIFPKQKTIANKLGVSEASVIRAIQELHKEGLIISERKYTNLYKFTAKIACYCPQNKIFCEDKMQDEILQIETNKLTNCELHVHEQTKEQILEQNVIENKKTVKVDDYKILKEYASSRVKNKEKINAYVYSIIQNGGASKIIAEEKAKKAANTFWKNEIIRTEQENAKYKEWIADDPNKCAAWVNIKKKFAKIAQK